MKFGKTWEKHRTTTRFASQISFLHGFLLPWWPQFLLSRGGNQFQSLGFQKATMKHNTTQWLSNKCSPRAGAAVHLPDIQQVINYTRWQHGKSPRSVTATTVGESLPERISEYAWVQAIVFLLQTHPQESFLGHAQHHANQAPGLQQPWSTGLNVRVLRCIDMCFGD